MAKQESACQAPSSLESLLRTSTESGAFEHAATRAIQGYGPEILGFLVAAHPDHDAAGDVFSQFCEDLWVGLPDFRWECSFRTWAYILARNALSRFLRDPWQQRAELLRTPRLTELENRVRLSTLTIIRNERRSRLARLRDKLDHEERMLLVLRVDRDLSWAEIAAVLFGVAPDDEEGVQRDAARLRKRFQRLKSTLKKLAKAEGLV